MFYMPYNETPTNEGIIMSNDNQNNNETTTNDLLKDLGKALAKSAAINAAAQAGAIATLAAIGYGIVKFQERKAKKNADK
jgi:hypothetical protein